jgi:peptidylprolyl isomerase
MTQTVKKGDTVKVHYTGRFDNGEVFDSSQGREPLQFRVGTQQIIKGL